MSPESAGSMTTNSPPIWDDLWRRLIHVLVHAACAASIVAFAPAVSALGWTVIALLFGWLDYRRLHGWDSINAHSKRFFGNVIRPWEYFRLCAPTWSLISLACLILACWALGFAKDIVALSAVFLAFSDPIAGLVRAGIAPTRRRWVRRVAGAAGFCPSAVLATRLFARAFPTCFVGHNVWAIAVVAGAGVAAVEALSCKRIDDNASIPAATTIVLLALLGSSRADLVAVSLLTLLLMLSMVLLNGSCTHRVGVAAIIVKDNKVLMMRRTHAPRIWAPPGGRLRAAEHPLAGLKREVSEECGLVVEPVRPVSIYMGDHQGDALLGVSIACRCVEGEPHLSEENSELLWVDPADYGSGPFRIDDTPALGEVEDYLAAVALVRKAEAR